MTDEDRQIAFLISSHDQKLAEAVAMVERLWTLNTDSIGMIRDTAFKFQQSESRLEHFVGYFATIGLLCAMVAAIPVIEDEDQEEQS